MIRYRCPVCGIRFLSGRAFRDGNIFLWGRLSVICPTIKGVTGLGWLLERNIAALNIVRARVCVCSAGYIFIMNIVICQRPLCIEGICSCCQCVIPTGRNIVTICIFPTGKVVTGNFKAVLRYGNLFAFIPVRYRSNAAGCSGSCRSICIISQACIFCPVCVVDFIAGRAFRDGNIFFLWVRLTIPCPTEEGIAFFCRFFQQDYVTFISILCGVIIRGAIHIRIGDVIRVQLPFCIEGGIPI